MDAKLTLKLDKEIIDGLKSYAKSQGISVSRLFEEYARKLVLAKSNKVEEPLADWLQDIDKITQKYPKTEISDEDIGLEELKKLRLQTPVIEKSDQELQEEYQSYLQKKYE